MKSWKRQGIMGTAWNSTHTIPSTMTPQPAPSKKASTTCPQTSKQTNQKNPAHKKDPHKPPNSMQAFNSFRQCNMVCKKCSNRSPWLGCKRPWHQNQRQWYMLYHFNRSTNNSGTETTKKNAAAVVEVIPMAKSLYRRRIPSNILKTGTSVTHAATMWSTITLARQETRLATTTTTTPHVKMRYGEPQRVPTKILPIQGGRQPNCNPQLPAPASYYKKKQHRQQYGGRKQKYGGNTVQLQQPMMQHPMQQPMMTLVMAAPMMK